MTDQEIIDGLRVLLAAARAEVADLLPILDAQDMRCTNLTGEITHQHAKLSGLRTALSTVRTALSTVRTALSAIIENRIEDGGPCDAGPTVCNCSECAARAALAAINKEE